MALRYVILRHDGVPAPHFDLMFETSPGSALATWRSNTWPPGPGPVQKLADHRRDYLAYEGPVSHGRGYVRRVEAGTYEPLPDSTPTVLALMLHGPPDRILHLRQPPA
jgi:hypothetical protein